MIFSLFNTSVITVLSLLNMVGTSKLLFGSGIWSMITLKLHKMVVWGPELFEGALAGVKQNCARNVIA